MCPALAAKWSFTDADVAKVWASIGQIITQAQAEAAVAAAAAEVTATLTSAQRATAVYGWSGGKDSQALRAVMETAGITRAVIGLIPAVEFRTYLNWVTRHAPAGLTRYENREITLPWLAARPGLVFPQNSRDGYWWTLAGTRRAQRLYQAEHDPPVQIYGRRRKDNNHIRSSLGPGMDPGSGGIVYCPIRDWSHELTLGVCYHYGMALPPVYQFPGGWRAGTGAWPGRRLGTPAQCWQATWDAEPDRVREAAQHLPAARRWMTAAGVL